MFRTNCYKFVEIEVSWNRSNEAFLNSGMDNVVGLDIFGVSGMIEIRFSVDS